MPKEVKVTKFDAEGKPIGTETLVKYKGKYIPKGDVPKRVRKKINMSFFAGALALMSRDEMLKADALLRAQE